MYLNLHSTGGLKRSNKCGGVEVQSAVKWKCKYLITVLKYSNWVNVASYFPLLQKRDLEIPDANRLCTIVLLWTLLNMKHNTTVFCTYQESLSLAWKLLRFVLWLQVDCWTWWQSSNFHIHHQLRVLSSVKDIFYWMKASKKTKSLSNPVATKVGSDSVEAFVSEGEPVGR